MKDMSTIYEALLDYEARSIINQSIHTFMKHRLQEEIDVALQQGDRAAFYMLTNELTKLEFWKTSS